LSTGRPSKAPPAIDPSSLCHYGGSWALASA
jgi:hypothetical protein